MSDNWLQFVPTDPQFIPSAEAAESARHLFASFVPESEEVTASTKDEIEFFHPMGNWSGVECPLCGADLEPWWEEAMERCAETQFKDLVTTVLCCGSRLSLNELRYVWPAAFARFVLEAMNPNVRDITQDQELALSNAVGCSLRKIWGYF